MLDYLKRSASELRFALLVLFVLAIVAFGFHAFNLILWGDDWDIILEPFVQKGWVVQIGRWGQRLIWELLADNRVAPTFTLFLLVVAMVVGCLLLRRAYRIQRPEGFLVFSGLLMFSPVWAEHIGFQTNQAAIGVGFVLVASCLYCCSVVLEQPSGRLVTNRYFVAAVATLFLAAGMRQETFLLALVLMCGTLVPALVEASRSSPPGSLGRPLRLYAAVVGSAAALYLVTSKALLVLFYQNTAPKEGSYQLTVLRNPAEALANVRRFLGNLSTFLFEGHHLWPAFTKYFFLLALAIWAVSLMARTRHVTRRPALAFGVIVLLAAALLTAPWLLSLVKAERTVVRYNALLGLAAVYPVIYSQALAYASARWTRRIVTSMASATILGFVFYHNVAAIAGYTSNQRDFDESVRILARIESTEAFVRGVADQKHTIYLVGRLAKAPEPPFNHYAGTHLSSSIVNEGGVYDAQTSRFPRIMKLVSYQSPLREFRILTRPEPLIERHGSEDLAGLIARLEQALPWPAGRSIVVWKQAVLVVLDDESRLDLIERIRPLAAIAAR